MGRISVSGRGESTCQHTDTMLIDLSTHDYCTLMLSPLLPMVPKIWWAVFDATRRERVECSKSGKTSLPGLPRTDMHLLGNVLREHGVGCIGEPGLLGERDESDLN